METEMIKLDEKSRGMKNTLVVFSVIFMCSVFLLAAYILIEKTWAEKKDQEDILLRLSAANLNLPDERREILRTEAISKYRGQTWKREVDKATKTGYLNNFEIMVINIEVYDNWKEHARTAFDYATNHRDDMPELISRFEDAVTKKLISEKEGVLP